MNRATGGKQYSDNVQDISRGENLSDHGETPVVGVVAESWLKAQKEALSAMQSMTKVASSRLLAPMVPATLSPADVAEGWMKAQHSALSAVQGVTERWLAHSQKYAEALQAAMEKMPACKDLGEISAVQRELISIAVHEAMAECDAIGNDAMKLSHSAAGLVTQTAKNASAGAAREASA